MLEKKIVLSSKKLHQPIQPKPHWFGLVSLNFIFKVNWTKSNRMFFYLVVRMTFNLKIESNCTANTPQHKYVVNTFPSLLTSPSPFDCSFYLQAHNTNISKRFSFLLNLVLFNCLTKKLCLTDIMSPYSPLHITLLLFFKI